MQPQSIHKGPIPKEPEDRFWHYVHVGTGCWEWHGHVMRSGYGQFAIYRDGRWLHVYAHRFAYEAERGPIPNGLQLDHLCRNRACVRPSHLEPVTQTENLRRGTQARITHCPHGHPYDEENTRLRNGVRQCHQCELIRNRRARAKRSVVGAGLQRIQG